MKKLLALGLLLTCMALLALPVNAETTPQPVGIIALKVTGVPAGTPTGSQLSWSFNGFTANATVASPTCTVNLTQSLSVDASSTLQADMTVGTLSNVYGLDYTVYEVNAYNDTLNHKAAGLMNLTLRNHYVPNEAWVTTITLTVYGNTSRLCNTLANWYIYNYTAGAYINMGLLNSTTRTSLTYTVSTAPATVIDETVNNSIMLKYNYTDTGNVDYLLDIDYIKIGVTYQFNIIVSNWTTNTQTHSP